MSSPPPPLADNLRDHWLIHEDVAFLNHGSFGAVPRPVLAALTQWREKIEAEPVELIWRQHDALLATTKRSIGEFLGMPPKDFGLVSNATEGANAVLQSLSLAPGDELLTTSHVYNAVRKAMQHLCSRTGAKYVEIPVPTPLQSGDAITAALDAAITARTKLVVVDHVTSPTAIVFPVRQIADLCARRNVDLFIDGAHAPGMLDLNVAGLNAAYYTGNLHKWCCAPRGSAFLHVRPDRQAHVHPPVISHHYGQGFTHEFDWQGTRDFANWHAAPAAIEFLGSFDWTKVRAHNHALAAWAHRLLVDRWKVSPLTPLTGELLGSMATVPLPPPLNTLSHDAGVALQKSLYHDDHIETPFHFWQSQWHLRVSAHVYNRPEEYERLAATVLRRAKSA